MGGVTYQLLPSLTYDEYQALKADIAARGVQVPVEVDDAGEILDGHHRVRVCAELGISEYPIIVRSGWSEEQKREHVLALNLDRRHLTREQRRELAETLRKDHNWSLRKIADRLHVTAPTVMSDLSGVKDLTPVVIGSDGKAYPAHRPAPPLERPAPLWPEAPRVERMHLDNPATWTPGFAKAAGGAPDGPIWQAPEESGAEPEPPTDRVRPVKSHADSYTERMAAPDAVNAPPDGYLDTIVRRDALAYLRSLTDGCAHMGITSPPYWAKREYASGDPNEIGKERHPEEYVDHLCAILAELPRVLTPRGVLFLNLGDTRGSQPGQYRGDPNRRRGISNQAILANGTATAGREHDLAADKTWCLVPESVVLRCALDYGWLVVSKIVWRKVGHGPENVYDRLTQAWEPVYVLAQHPYPWFWGALDGKRVDDVWDIPVGRQGDASGHLAPFPDGLVERAIHHACPPGGVALDFFAGSGTVLDVARRMGRHFLGCDLVAATPTGKEAQP